MAPSSAWEQAKTWVKAEVPQGGEHTHPGHQPRLRSGRPPHPRPPPLHGLHHTRREQGAAACLRAGGGRGRESGGGDVGH